MSIWSKLFPAKKPEWNDLEQALLDDLQNNPGDWEFSREGTSEIRCYNRRRQLVTYVRPSWYGSSCWDELLDSVGTEFRTAFSQTAAARLNEETARKRKKEAEETATKVRQALDLG